MARFLWYPMLIEFHELFDETEKRIPVESLSTNGLAKVQVYLEVVIYRESEPRGACVHAFHIHVGSEERYFTVFISVRLHTLEECLGVVQNRCGRLNGKRTVYERISDFAFIIKGTRSTHMEQSLGSPSRKRRSTGWSTCGLSEIGLSARPS